MYQDTTRCSTCSYADAPTNTIKFDLTSVSNGGATGRLTSVTYPGDGPGGASSGQSVQVSLLPADQLQLAINGDQNLLPFCGPSTPSGTCGA
jgi:hypothetical protein